MKGCGWWRLAAYGLAIAGAPAAAQSPDDPRVVYEQQVLDAVNFARTDPAGYAAMLERYKAYFRGKRVSMPGQPADFDTDEGVAVVDETIAFLRRQAPLPPVAAAPLLQGSAAEHTVEQGASGAIGHEGADGSSPGDRARRHGGGPYVAEVIAYGPMDAIDAVRQLIVDDGVADRGHRTILYSPELAFAGVSCGPHREYRTMCTIDLGLTAEGRLPEARMADGPHPRQSAQRTDRRGRRASEA